MNRRNFLMKLGAAMIGALVVRPTVDDINQLFKPTQKQLDWMYGGNAGGGKSILNLYGIPYHQSNTSTGTWLGFSRTK